MSRNFKALGLALVAVVALSAMAATAAQANNVTASKYNARITGTDLGTKAGEYTRLTVGNGARFVECATSTIEATLTKEETAVTATPSYSGCFSNADVKIPATVTMNGCDYILEATSKTAGRATVVCPVGKQIEVHIYENATKHTENKPLCTYDIKAQGPLTTVNIGTSNAGTATEDLLLGLAVTGIKTTSTIGSTIVCGIAAGAEGTSTLKGNITATGEEDVAEKPAHVAVMIA